MPGATEAIGTKNRSEGFQIHSSAATSLKMIYFEVWYEGKRSHVLYRRLQQEITSIALGPRAIGRSRRSSSQGCVGDAFTLPRGFFGVGFKRYGLETLWFGIKRPPRNMNEFMNVIVVRTCSHAP
jgi:hypothetical protein